MRDVTIVFMAVAWAMVLVAVSVIGYRQHEVRLDLDEVVVAMKQQQHDYPPRWIVGSTAGAFTGHLSPTANLRGFDVDESTIDDIRRNGRITRYDSTTTASTLDPVQLLKIPCAPDPWLPGFQMCPFQMCPTATEDGRLDCDSMEAVIAASGAGTDEKLRATLKAAGCDVR